MDLQKRSLELHDILRGKSEIKPKFEIENSEDLSLYYTPGVAEPCRKIAENKDDVYKYTGKGNLVAVITDGSAVLGLGNIGGEAGLPVMEGKCVLLKRFGNVDAISILLDTQDVEEMFQTIKNIAPSFGGINLEDISAPRCFELEERLIEALDIPVFHDDQHGTAIVTLAGLINAAKVVGKKIEDLKIVVNGAGAAGMAISKLLIDFGVRDLILIDSQGIIEKSRDDLNFYKKQIAEKTNKNSISGGLKEALIETDVFIGVSQPGVLNVEMVKLMADKSIVFAMANPTPEIFPEEAIAGGAAVVATGRSDFPNQINNVLAFPGLFRGILDSRKRKITTEMKLKAAVALANFVENPTAEKIIPSPFEKGVAETVAKAVSN